MSILNLYNDGYFTVLTSIIAVVKDAGNSIEKPNLFEILGRNYVKEPKHVRDTLNTWKNLGFFLEASDKISIKEAYFKKLPTSPRPGDGKLQLLLLEVLMVDVNNKNLWADKLSQNNDFTRCCCYILGKDIFFISSKTQDQIIQETGVDGSNIEDPAFLIQNKTRMTGVIHWMTALGILTGSINPTIDPTIMVRSVISDSFAKGEDVAFEMFLKKLNTKFPIMDGGQYRLETETKLQSRTTNLLKNNRVSVSLSFALRRLEAKGIIKFLNKGDAEKFTLLGRDLQTVEEVSHLKCKGR